MNKLLKVLVATFGGVNLVFELFIPLAIALMSIGYFHLTGYKITLLMVIAIASTIYRVINVLFLRD